MVRPILRPMFEKIARGYQSPQGKMFMGAYIAPQMIDSVTDISQQTDITDVDITEDITDINVTSKKETPPKNSNNAPVGPSQNSINEAKKNEKENISVINDNVTTGSTDTGIASTQAQNNPEIAAYIDNDSVSRIDNYKKVIRQFLGESSGGDKLQSTALLLQLGTALMSGRTDQPGLRGFFDVVGQAGAQTAPMLFEMGVQKQKADREINAAALDMYFAQMDDMSDRSGPYMQVYQNYKTNDDGSLAYGPDNKPIKLDQPAFLLDVKRTSPEESNFYETNQAYGMNIYELVEKGEGSTALTSFSQNMTLDKSKGADVAAQQKYANYLKRGLEPLAEDILPLLIDRKEMSGFQGQVGEILGPYSELFEDFTGKVISGEFDSPDETGNGFTVREGMNGTMNIRGKELPVFIDHEDKYGGNGMQQERFGTPLEDGGYGTDSNGNPKRAYIVAGTLTKMLESGSERAILETFQTTLGLMLARDRQPTGRMLADVLRRSFDDVKISGIKAPTAAVIQNYMRIYNQLYDNMSNSLRLAGENEEDYKFEGSNPLDNPFHIKGNKKLSNSYYTWLEGQDQLAKARGSSTESFRQTVSGGLTQPEWRASFGANIELNHQEDMNQSNQTKESLMEKWSNF